MTENRHDAGLLGGALAAPLRGALRPGGGIS